VHFMPPTRPQSHSSPALIKARKTVELWDVTSGKKITEFVYKKDIQEVVFSQNGKKLAILTNEGVVRVIRLGDREVEDRFSVERSRGPWCEDNLVFCSNDTYLALSSGKKIHIFDFSKKKPTWYAFSYNVKRFMFSPNSRWLLVMAADPEGRNVYSNRIILSVTLIDVTNKREKILFNGRSHETRHGGKMIGFSKNNMYVIYSNLSTGAAMYDLEKKEFVFNRFEKNCEGYCGPHFIFFHNNRGLLSSDGSTTCWLQDHFIKRVGSQGISYNEMNKVYDVSRFGLGVEIDSVSMTPDDRFVLFKGAGNFLVLDLQKPSKRRKIIRRENFIFSEKHKQKNTFFVEKIEDNYIQKVQFTPDYRFIVAVSGKGLVRKYRTSAALRDSCNVINLDKRERLDFLYKKTNLSELMFQHKKVN